MAKVRGEVSIEVRRAESGELDRAAQVLGEAFANYAWTRWTVDPDDHRHRVTQLQRLALEHYGFAFGHVWVSVVDGCIHSVAVWMDSSIVVPSIVHEHVHPLTAELEGTRHVASVTAQRELDGWKPQQHHYYLATMGTTPALQSRGLATAALMPMLASADDEGVDAFLETSSPANTKFYAALGFEVVDHRRISGGGPDVWAMLRRPQAVQIRK